MQRFMKIIAVLTLIVGIIGGIVLGSVHQTLVAAKYSFQDATLEFNVEMMLSTWVYSILLFGVLYSIGNILEMLAQIVKNTTPPPADTEEKEEKEVKEGYVRCKECGEENKTFETHCGKCGAPL